MLGRILQNGSSSSHHGLDLGRKKIRKDEMEDKDNEAFPSFWIIVILKFKIFLLRWTV
jgi:hypothetical protein